MPDPENEEVVETEETVKATSHPDRNDLTDEGNVVKLVRESDEDNISL